MSREQTRKEFILFMQIKEQYLRNLKKEYKYLQSIIQKLNNNLAKDQLSYIQKLILLTTEEIYNMNLTLQEYKSYLKILE